jgi:hypothetical protein
MVFILLIAAVIAYAVGATAVGGVLSALFAIAFLGSLAIGAASWLITPFIGNRDD